MFLILMSSSGAALAMDALSYSGRLVNSNGSPVAGPVNLQFVLSYTSAPGAALCTKSVSSVPLAKGIFHVKLDFTASDCVGTQSLEEILSAVPPGETVAVQVTDQSNSRTYPAQAMHSIPSSIVAKLALGIAQLGATSGQYLQWDGTKWTPASIVGGAGGTVTSITAGSGLQGGTITASGTIAIATGGVSTTMLADGAVTDVKLAGSISRSKLAAGTVNTVVINGAGGLLGEAAQLPVALGGTGAANAADARASLGLGSSATTNVGTAIGSVMAVDAVPSCAADDKLQMSPGPVYTWSCVADEDATKLPLTGGTMLGAVSLNGNPLTGLTTPLTASEATPKSYVDALVSSSNFWSEASGNINRSSGRVGVGVASPTGALHLRAGVATASGAPLKLTSGTLLTTPESGAVEFDGTGLYFTDSGNVRRSLVSSGGALSSVSSVTGSGALTVSSGGTNQNLTLAASGTGTVQATSPLVVTSSTASTSTSTGATVIAGGLGVGGSVNASTLAAGDGTAALPSHTFTSSTGSGLYLPAANQVGLSTNGVERVRVLANGNVGVGIMAPDTILDVNGTMTIRNTADSSAATVRTFAPWAGATTMAVESGTAYWGGYFSYKVNSGVGAGNIAVIESTPNGSATATAGGALALYGSASTVGTMPKSVYLQSSGVSYFNGGNVGIGTTSPTSALSFSSAAASKISPERPTAGNGVDLTISGGGGASGALNVSGGNLTLQSGVSTGMGSSKILFQTSGNYSFNGTVDLGLTTKMSIDGFGKVAIGSSAASAAFDVYPATVLPYVPAAKGALMSIDSAGYNLDSTTAASGTTALVVGSSFAQASFRSLNTGVTWTNGANVYIAGAARRNSLGVFTNSSALYVAPGATTSAETTNAYGLYVNAPTGTATNYTATFMGGNVGVGTASPRDLLSLGSVVASATRASLNLSNTALVGASTNGTYIGANPATASADFINYQVNGSTKFSVDQNGTITGKQAYVTLSDGATVTWTLGGIINNASVTLGGNRTLSLSGLSNGMGGTLIVNQDGTGSRTLTLPSECTNKVINGGAGAVTLSTAAGSVDILTFTYDGTNCYWTYGNRYN